MGSSIKIKGIGDYISRMCREQAICRSNLHVTLERWAMIEGKQILLADKELEKIYSELEKKLNNEFPNCREKTPYERKAMEIIGNWTKMEVKKSFWIGKFNCDLFFPQVGIKGRGESKGYVIEVDGSVHNRYLKMLKDQDKYELLYQLGIPVWAIDNERIRDPMVRDTFKQFPELFRMDSRARSRLMRKIHLVTICSCYSDDEFLDFLSTYVKCYRILRPSEVKNG